MAKFSGLRANVTAPVRTLPQPTPTHAGGGAYVPDAESELFLLAATNMVGEDTFYEGAAVRDARFVDLVHRVTASNPAFVAGLVPYLRQTMLMRSAAVVMAAEYVAAGGPFGRAVVNGALQRPDEPAELLGYWLAVHGRRVPMAVKRGVADAVRRLYSERAALRYDGLARGMRMADVVELTHPEPRDARQSALFRWLLDRRHHDDAAADPAVLPCWPPRPRSTPSHPTTGARTGPARAFGTRRGRLLVGAPVGLAAAAFGHARRRWHGRRGLGGGHPVDGRDGPGPQPAQLRPGPDRRDRGRDGDRQAHRRGRGGKGPALPVPGVGRLRRRAIGRLEARPRPDARPDGRQHPRPRRDPCGDRHVGLDDGDRVASLDRAACGGRRGHGHGHRPPRPGRRRRRLRRLQRSGRRSGGCVGPGRRGQGRRHGRLGRARNLRPHRHRPPLRRKAPPPVVLFTDDQQHDSGHVRLDHVPLIYTFDRAGYRPSALPAGQRGRYTLGGFTDATFTAMKVLEAGRDARWPFVV